MEHLEMQLIMHILTPLLLMVPIWKVEVSLKGLFMELIYGIMLYILLKVKY